RIEEIYQVKRGEPDFDFARMNLRKPIKKHRTDLEVKAQKGGLLICPDLLASEHLARFVKRGERIIKNGARELANRVDTRGFDEGQKKLHETRTRVGQGFVLGIQWAKRSLRSGALPEVSPRPRLPGPKNV